MSLTLEQIYALNPSTTINDTDLFYLVQSPYTPGTDSGISGLSLKNLFVTIPGSTSLTTLGTITTGIWHATTIGAIYGGTGLTFYTLGDMLYASAANTLARLAGNTTATKNFLSQTGTGVVSAPPLWTTISASDIGGGQALTRVDDTNVTLTLGGTPATALLQATSLTLGWTGTLSGIRGGTGVNNGANTATFAGNLNFASAFTTSGAFAVTQTYTGITNVTFPTSGTLATTAQIPTGAALTKTDDTNVTLTLGGSPTTALVNAASLTLGWTGELGLTRGGTAASLTASNGGIVYSTASAFAILAGTATAGQILRSGSSTTPSWSTATYPATAGTSGNLLISNGTNYISSTSLWPNTVGSSGKVVISDGTSNVYSTPTFPNASATLNKIIKSDGTNWIASTETYAAPGTSGNVMTSDGTNWTSASASGSLPTGALFNFQQAQLTTPVTTTSTTFVDATGLSVTITPTSASNKVLVRASIQVGTSTSQCVLKLVRGSTDIAVGTSVGSRQACSANTLTVGSSVMGSITIEWLDSPATTSATTYKIQFLSGAGVAVAINSSVLDTNAATLPRTASTISVCEVKV